MIPYCIFVEKIWDDVKFKLLLDFIEKKITIGFNMMGGYLHDTSKINLFVITPANYYLAVSEQGYKGTKKQFDKILRERYQQLEWTGCKINLHLHLAMNPESCDQKAMFKEAMDWMEKNDYHPDAVTFGWYIFNQKSLKLILDQKILFFIKMFFRVICAIIICSNKIFGELN